MIIKKEFNINKRMYTIEYDPNNIDKGAKLTREDITKWKPSLMIAYFEFFQTFGQCGFIFSENLIKVIIGNIDVDIDIIDCTLFICVEDELVKHIKCNTVYDCLDTLGCYLEGSIS